MANRKVYTGFPTSHQPRFYAAPNFFKMGIKYLDLLSFIQVSTIKDEKSAAKFHYIKTVSSIVVPQYCLSSGINILTGGRPIPPEILAETVKLTHPLLKAPCFGSFCLVAPQPKEIEKEVQLHLTRTRNEPSTKILRCP